MTKLIRSGQTTGNRLTDEVILLRGLDGDAIARINAFSADWSLGQEVLISVPRLKCTRHVFIPTPGHDNEYVTLIGYIYGIPSGEGIMVNGKGKEHPAGFEIILPFKRYVMWDFEHMNTVTPAEGPLVVDGNIFVSPSAERLLDAIISDGTPISLEKIEKRMLHRSDILTPEIKITIISKDKDRLPAEHRGETQTHTALEHGRREIQESTPGEKIAGGGI